MKKIRYWLKFNAFGIKQVRKFPATASAPAGKKVVRRRKFSRTVGNLSVYNTNQLFL